MLTKTQERILEYLLTKEKDITIRGLARAIKSPYALTYNNTQDLLSKEILTKKDLPPAQIINISKKIPQEILLYIEGKRKQVFLKKFKGIGLMLKDILSYTKDPFFTLAIFGSYAKGTQTAHSDLDLLMIVPSKKELSSFENAIHKIYTLKKLSPIIITTEDFREMVKRSAEFNVGNETKKHHILLHGAEQWYTILKESEYG